MSMSESEQLYPASGTLRDGIWIRKVPSIFSFEQVSQYLTVIGHEPHFSATSLASGEFIISLDSLERVMRLHLLTFPFENTAMHYTPEHCVDVNPEGLFQRFVQEKKGSYCFGQNYFLLEILRGLGFRAYVTIGRANTSTLGALTDLPTSYAPPTHLVILTQPSLNNNQTYVVDVGYGARGLTRPLLLSVHPENVIEGLSSTERHRLTKTPREDSSLSPTQDLSLTDWNQWNLEVWHQKSDSSREKWRILYSFPESENWWPDINHSSFVVSNRAATTMLWTSLICVKMFTVDEGYEHLEKSKRPTYRLVLAGNQVKRQEGSVSQLVCTLSTELDRIHALREYFGINLQDTDVDHIVGRAPALSVIA